MNAKELEYTKLTPLLSKYATKGRSESANFLNWFLENIYRLDEVSADDAICDQSNDKGIDGVYVDHNAEEIHFFQSKLSQKKRSTIGDAAVKQFVASVSQFNTPKKVERMLAGNANAELKNIIRRNNITELLNNGYALKAIFVANSERDNNTRESEKSFDNLAIFAASDIASNFIEFDAEEGIDGKFCFDTSYSGVIELAIGDGVKAFVLPVSATDLVNLEGIADGKLFSQNVRYSLGKTPVNKAIEKSVASQSEHKNFSLYHNGVTLICKDAKLLQEKDLLEIQDYVVVNGAQSITTFFHNRDKLTKDLRIFVKVISLTSEELSSKITINSNNQNSIKPRDLRSNHDIMLRLRSEFESSKCGYQFEIKRGQPLSGDVTIISNEDAGRELLAFDLDEPYSCHQIYRVFDDKYAEIFGRREVTFGRIVFLRRLREIVSEALGELKNKPMSRYSLTKYFLINTIGAIMRLFDEGRKFLADVNAVNSEAERKRVLDICREIVQGVVVDLNFEIGEVDEGFDYKRELKSPESVREWRAKLLRTYEKDFKRGKAGGFGLEIAR